MIEDKKGVKFSAQITLGSLVSMIGISATLIGCYANFRSRLDVIENRQAMFSDKVTRSTLG